MRGIIGKDVMEREAVKRLFMQHYARMQRVARTLLYDVQESEDVCQDIFESLLRGEDDERQKPLPEATSPRSH